MHWSSRCHGKLLFICVSHWEIEVLLKIHNNHAIMVCGEVLWHCTFHGIDQCESVTVTNGPEDNDKHGRRKKDAAHK